MEEFEIGERVQKYIYPSTPLHMKCDHLVPHCYLEQQIENQKYLKIQLEGQIDQEEQGTKGDDMQMIKDDRFPLKKQYI